MGNHVLLEEASPQIRKKGSHIFQNSDHDKNKEQFSCSTLHYARVSSSTLFAGISNWRDSFPFNLEYKQVDCSNFDTDKVKSMF